MLAFCPAHGCLWVSAIPIGLTPGHLFSVSKREASRSEVPFGLTRVVQILLASRVQSLSQQWTSRPEGPAAHLTCRATLHMQLAVIWSDTTGWTGGGSALPIIKSPGLAGVALGCLERKICSTDFTSWSPRSMLSSTCRTPPLPCWESS